MLYQEKNPDKLQLDLAADIDWFNYFQLIRFYNNLIHGTSLREA